MRAAALLVCLLVAGCSAAPVASARPTAEPTTIPFSPTPTGAPTPPGPAPVTGRLVGIDWATTRAIDLPARGSQSPDGSRLLSGGQVTTIGGEVVGAIPAGKRAWRWADDSRHLCAAYYDSPTPPDNSTRTPTGLYETLPGSAPTLIAQVGYLVAQSSPFMLGCSFGHGSATVGESCIYVLCEAWTVDLMSHQVVSHLTSFNVPGQLEGVLSPDGTLLAVSDYNGGSAAVYRTADGSVLATLSGSRVVAFIADDGAVLVQHPSGPAQLLDLSGRVIATLPGAEVQSALAEPGGHRLAVALGNPGASSTGYPGPADLVVVGEDGQVALIAQGVLPQF